MSLDALVASGLILRQAGQATAYSFKHVLIRDAAYDIMVRASGAAPCTRGSRRPSNRISRVVAGHPEILALHFTEGELVEKAAPSTG